MHLTKAVAALYFAIIIMVGCAPAVYSIKVDKEYGNKIHNIAIVEQQNDLTDRYDMLRDRVHKSTDSLTRILAKNNVKSKLFTLKTLELNRDKKLDEYAHSIRADHIVTVKPIKAIVNIYVDFYDLEFTVIDTKTNKIILLTNVKADWYTDANEIASETIKGFVENGLL